VAIVTGGAGGLGSAVVDRFLNDGASVAIIDLNAALAQKLMNNEWKQYSGKVKHYSVDVSKR